MNTSSLLPRRIRAVVLSAISLLAFSALAPVASAITITIGSTNYDVTSTTAIYDNDAALLESQVWWGNQSLAEQFAVAVNTQLGTPNFYTHSPFFSYAVSGGNLISAYWFGGLQTFSAHTSHNYWVATTPTTPALAVPESASTLALLLLSLVALGFAGTRRSTRKA